MNAQLVWNLLVKGSVILVLALFASVAVRRSSAPRRHLVWLTAILSLLLIPIAEIRLPNWNVPVERSEIIVPLVAPAPLRQPATPLPEAKRVYVLDVAAPFAKPAPVSPITWSSIVWFAWLTGCASVFAWMGFGLLQVLKLIRSGRKWDLPQSVKEAVDPKTRILICPSLRVAATAGIFHPLILLPEEAQIWGERRLRMVLAHESAHIRRSDWMWQLVSQIACALHFFNPLAWLAMMRLRSESEYACDDHVLSIGIEPESYAHELLDIARSSRFQLASTVGMASTKKVEGRLKAIIDSRQKRTSVSGRTLIGVLAVTALFATPIALLKALPTSLTNRKQIQVRHSRKPMPQIPWVASKEISPNVFLAKDGVAGLPEGFRVRLVGLSTDRSTPWDVNSQPLPDANLWRGGGAYWQGNVFHRWSYGFSPNFAALSRTFIVEVESENDAVPATTCEITRPERTTKLQKLNPIYGGGDDRIPEVKLPARDPAFARIDLSIPTKASTATFRFGIANSNWTTVADVRNPTSINPEQIARADQGNGQKIDDCGISLGDSPELSFRLLGAKRGTVVDLDEPGTHLSKDLAQRVLLFDKQGNPMTLKLTPEYDTSGYPRYDIPAIEFCKIGRVVLQTTPYQWAEFQDVPLRPDYEKEEASRLDSGIRGTATGIAPGFSQTLSNGVAVSLTAVTKAIQDGNNWSMVGQPSWRGDGKVLAKGPEILAFPHPVNSWSKYPLVRYDIQLTGAPKDASTYLEATGQVDPAFLVPSRIFTGNEPNLSVDNAYLPGATFGSLRVGIATGRWNVIARHTIDIDELPSIHPDPDTPQIERTGFTVVLGKNPSLILEATKKEITLTTQVPKGSAIRAVAVLHSGEIREIRAAGSTVNQEPLCSVPARHGEQTEYYSNLIASQVKEIEIQTRPYQWAEFHGIPLSPK